MKKPHQGPRFNAKFDLKEPDITDFGTGLNWLKMESGGGIL
jgi:hypothetical protein